MTQPLIFEVKRNPNIQTKKLVGEHMEIIPEGSGNVVPAVVIQVESDVIYACTDYFDRLCPVCPRETCPYNDKYRRR